MRTRLCNSSWPQKWQWQPSTISAVVPLRNYNRFVKNLPASAETLTIKNLADAGGRHRLEHHRTDCGNT